MKNSSILHIEIRHYYCKFGKCYNFVTTCLCSFEGVLQGRENDFHSGEGVADNLLEREMKGKFFPIIPEFSEADRHIVG